MAGLGDDAVYEYEDIVGSKYCERTKEFEFDVAWKGYIRAENSMVKYGDINRSSVACKQKMITLLREHTLQTERQSKYLVVLDN